MSKIDGVTESIFAHAVALESSGRLKNAIYVIDKRVLILNSDHTVLLSFSIPANSAPFSAPISFKADDYDSSTFYEEDGRIVFVQKSGDMERRKFSGKAQETPEEIQALFDGMDLGKAENTAAFHRDMIPLLNENLSHVEFSGIDGEIVVKQRNIFDGTVIEIRRAKDSGFGVGKKDKIVDNFGPLGMRTGDFIALFSFNDEVVMEFPSGPGKYATVRGRNHGMTGIASLCIYDELGEITYITELPDGESVEPYDNTKWVWATSDSALDDYFTLNKADLDENWAFIVLGDAEDKSLMELEKLIQENGYAGTWWKEQEDGGREQTANPAPKKRKRGTVRK